jgi:hypothetical protein
MVRYVPISEATLVRVSGLDVSARLFGYNRDAFTNGFATDRRAVLVVWGPAGHVAKLASYGNTSKGQQKLAPSHLAFIQSCACSMVSQPELLVGIASADVLLEHIGSKAVPTDVMSLVVSALNLSYLGALACNPAPPRVLIDGIKAIGEQCAKVACLLSFTKDELTLRSTLQRCGLEDVRVVVPDVLNRWRQGPPPVHRQAVAFPLLGVSDLKQTIHDICGWLGRTRGLAFCAASSYGICGMKAANFAVALLSRDDAVTSAVLEGMADVTVCDYDLVQLAGSIHGAAVSTNPPPPHS